MSSDPITPDPALVAEIDRLIEQIKRIHEKHGRAIAKKIKRARKGRKQLQELSTFGASATEELRALYWNWNGAPRGARMSKWDSSVFLQHQWVSADVLIDWFRIAQLEKQTHSEDGLSLFLGGREWLMLLQNGPQQDNTSLVAALPWAQRVYHAFDGIVPMLRSVIAADEAGVISYAPDRVDGEDGKIIVEANEIQYDPAALWEVIKLHNPRTVGEEFNYWRALATDTLEFDGEPPDISSGVIEMKPEVQEIVFREVIEQKKKWDKKLAKKMRDE